MNPHSSSRGFTLIEVLVSLIILSIGLLGLGLLQARSLQTSFSANQRTVATNLAYQMIDMMRATDPQARYNYAYIDFGDAAGQNDTTCNRLPTGGALIADDSAGWLCQVSRELPNGDADVAYAPGGPGVAGTATVTLRWTDAHWQLSGQQTTFVVASQL